MNQPRSFTLSQFAAFVGNAIRRDPALQGAWVLAELSDFRSGPGGHCYMELIEKDARGATIAKMRANMWSNVAASVIPRFQAATGRNLASGLKVMLYGSATFHQNFGLSFSIADIDPSFTLGDLERLRREILEKLNRLGVLEANRSLPLPVAPQRIAVISSEGAAGYGDFINHLSTTPEGFVFYPVLIPAVMQGESTGESVMSALDYIESCVDLWDLVVIIRGGGSTTDLNGFDNFDLARRVATYPLPVVVGIGHERDRTVLDDIAAVRCKTPTAVAGWLADTLRNAWNRVGSLVDRIADDAVAVLNAENRRFSNIEAFVPVLVQKKVADHRLMLADIAARIPLAVASRTTTQRNRLDYLAQNLSHSASSYLQRSGQHLEALKAVVSALDPSATLRRGFSITRHNGRALTDSAGLHQGDKIVTTLANGTITSTV